MEYHARTSVAELDHLFLIVSDEQTAREMMDQAGFRINYSRVHPGQGTRNFCACLDDIFLELLWFDGTEVSDQTEAITIGARGRGQGLPFGVSWRGLSPYENEKRGIIPYFAPFLPEGVSIPVAAESLDSTLPFVFRTPGGTPPIERNDGLVGERQAPNLATLGLCEMFVPNVAKVRNLLSPFSKIVVRRGQPALRFSLLRPDGSVGKTVEWPVGI